MDTILTFIIPVRHQENARDWQLLKDNLTDTICSISAQKNKLWKAIIVANHGADLPKLPEQFDVKYVDFPPNSLHEQGNIDKETFYDAVRLDKGRRVLAGMLHAKNTKYFMIVDDDDFISNRLTEFISNHVHTCGWYVENGYIWVHRGRVLYRYSDFSSFCGTSLIIRADLYDLPDSFALATEEYIKRMLGSHVFIRKHLEGLGNALTPLPFVGAIYRVGHSGSHSQSQPSMIIGFFKRKILLKKPVELINRICRLRWLTTDIKKEFFGHV